MTHPSQEKLLRIWTHFAPFTLALLAADQLSKWWAQKSLPYGQNVDFGFTLHHNPGITFGIELPLPAIYAISVLILAAGAYLVYENKLWRDTWHLAGLALLLAGALGNLLDRIRFGYVIDFVKIYWWPTFNLADVFIVAAVALFMWEFVVREDGLKKL